MIFPPLLSVKNSVAIVSGSWLAPSDGHWPLWAKCSLSAWRCSQGCRVGVGGLLSDPFSASNNSIKLIELESFLLLVTVQTTLFYFCWVGTNWPARQLTMFMTHSPGSLSKHSQSWGTRSLQTLWVRQEVPLQEQISAVAGWMAILIRSQPWLLFQCHSWGKLGNHDTSPGTLSSNCYTEHGSAWQAWNSTGYFSQILYLRIPRMFQLG